jgi:hypothetical protein
VQLKLKYSDHALVTRRRTLDTATDDGRAIYEAAAGMLVAAQGGRSVRLTGVSGQELEEPARQMDLFQRGSPKRARLNAALDEISRRYGSKAVVPADLAGSEELEDELEEIRRRAGASRQDAARRPRKDE